mmetsp:Transcript_1606/g.2258  ORF Transcript_1606/g.2258 Transcript_1606/m.2258 type:complete len:209 (+) Transcript_1606:1114-1740(+)
MICTWSLSLVSLLLSLLLSLFFSVRPVYNGLCLFKRYQTPFRLFDRFSLDEEERRPSLRNSLRTGLLLELDPDLPWVEECSEDTVTLGLLDTHVLESGGFGFPLSSAASIGVSVLSIAGGSFSLSLLGVGVPWGSTGCGFSEYRSENRSISSWFSERGVMGVKGGIASPIREILGERNGEGAVPPPPPPPNTASPIPFGPTPGPVTIA